VKPARTTCRACSAPIAPGDNRCDACGSPQSDAIKCPLCGAVANTSPDAEFGYKCDVCGGPRIPVEDSRVSTGGREGELLRKADEARHDRAKRRALAMGLGLLGAGLLGIGLLLSLLFPALGVPVAVLGAFSFVGTYLAFQAGQRAGKAIPAAIDAAWEAAAAAAVDSLGTATAETLAKALGIELSRAEELLARLEVSDLARADGRGVYTTRARFAAPAPLDEPIAELEAAAETKSDAEALAELEAFAAAEEASTKARADGEP
jgi:hypothetical protein